MKTYTLKITRTRTDVGQVDIEAENKEDALLKAAINAEPDKLIVDLATARKKKKYHVVMQSIEYYGIDVEAYDEYEAMELAENADGGEFVFEDNTPWEINEVKEVEE